MPLLEREIRDYLVTNVASVESSFTKVGMMDAVTQSASGARTGNLNAVSIYSNGGESENIIRIRIMTRGNKFSTAMDLANDVYNQLQRLNDTDLPTYKLYYVTGERPQQSGRDQGGGFLTSADYMIRFSNL